MKLYKIIEPKTRRDKFAMIMLGLGSVLIVQQFCAFFLPSTGLSAVAVALYTIVAFFIAVPIHEGLHGLFFKIYTDHTSFGVLWSWAGPVFYATSRGRFLSRRQAIVTALAPQLLTVIGLVVFVVVVHMFSMSVLYTITAIVALNLGGGCSDLWCVSRIRHCPREAVFEDTRTGLNVWVKE